MLLAVPRSGHTFSGASAASSAASSTRASDIAAAPTFSSSRAGAWCRESARKEFTGGRMLYVFWFRECCVYLHLIA
jgi:hypothetical protein